MEYQIFVSYRRDGGEALACLISEKLKQRGYKTFYDVESLRSGKFNEKIFQVIDSCADVIVVLPQHGLDRCTNDDDWVRKEIAYAIKTNKNIIPVLMRNFEFPKALPEDINDLKNFHGISATMEYFDAAFLKLVSMIKSSISSTSKSIVPFIPNGELQERFSKLIAKVEENDCAENVTELADFYLELNNDSLSEEMAKLYAKAANFGYAIAQNSLGDCYYKGKGVEKNIEKALEWYKKAADQGLNKAQYNLAICFERNHEELAFIWMKKVADVSRDSGALYKIGEYYEYGTGTEKNYDLAKKYYMSAEDEGHPLAESKTSSSYWRKKAIKDFFSE